MEFRAQVDDLKVGILQTQNMLNGLALTTQESAQKINTAGKQMGDTFTDLDRKTLATASRFARFGATMILLQGQISQMADGVGKHFGKLETTATAAGHGLASFITVVGAFPTPVGVAIGLVAGMTSAFMHAAKAVQQVYDEMEKLEEKIQQNLNRKVFPELAKQLTAQQTAFGATAPLEVSITRQTEALEKLNEQYLKNNDLVEQNRSKLQQLATQRASIKADLDRAGALRDRQTAKGISDPELDENIERMIGQLSALDFAEANLRITIEDTNRSMDQQNKTIEKSVTHLRALNGAKELAATKDQALKLLETLDQLGVAGEAQLRAGLIEPAAKAQHELAAANNALLKMLEANVALDKAASKLSAVGDDEGARALENQKFGGEDLSQLKDRVARITAELASDKRVNQMAAGFADAIGGGLRDAILNAQKPMEALAGIGRNLFENMVNQVTTQLQTGLVAVFKQVSAAGGEALGTAVTGVLGILGGIFSRRAGVEQTYKDLSSAVTSTQAVRGVVAGPSSVAVANVSADIGRAFQPVLKEAQEHTRLLRLIELNTRGGGRQPAVGVGTA